MGASPDNRVCDNCGRWVEENEILYHARLQLYAEPRISALEVEEDAETRERRWNRLIESMQNMDDDQVQEATDQVHEEIRFHLCPQCRAETHSRIRMRREIL